MKVRLSIGSGKKVGAGPKTVKEPSYFGHPVGIFVAYGRLRKGGFGRRRVGGARDVTALALNIILTVFFFHTVRSAQSRGQNVMVVAVVNYVVASPICFLLSYAQGVTTIASSTIFWGFVQGVCFTGTFYLLCSAMDVSGMAITTAILRLAVVIPVVASVVVWEEIPNSFQIGGIVACLVALPLIGLRQKTETAARDPITPQVLMIVTLLFVGMGIANLSSKAFVESGVTDVATTFVGVLFGVAGVCGLFAFLSPQWRNDLSGTAYGVRLGVINVGSIVSHVVALEQVPGVIAFPVIAAGGMLLNTLFAAWVWEERFVRKTIAGMVIAVVGLVLVNIE